MSGLCASTPQTELSCNELSYGTPIGEARE